MKLIVAVALVMMLAVPALAQSLNSNPPPGPPPPPPKSRQEIEAERSAEQAYRNSLKNIPDQPAADPWGNARSVGAPKAATTTKKLPAKAGSTAN
jgi:hypothetical protein